MGDCFTAASLTRGSFSFSVCEGGANCILYWFAAEHFKECFSFGIFQHLTDGNFNISFKE